MIFISIFTHKFDILCGSRRTLEFLMTKKEFFSYFGREKIEVNKFNSQFTYIYTQLSIINIATRVSLSLSRS